MTPARALRRVVAHRAFVRVVGMVLGAIFVYASLDKITHPDRFADMIHDYQMLPLALVNAWALAMPWVEMMTGAVLILGLWRRAGGLLATALTAAFLIAIAQAESRGLRIECGCFNVSGMSSREASWGLFGLDVVQLLGCALVWRRG